MPEVLAKPSLCGELAVIGEVVVPLFGMQLAQVSFLVCDVEHDLEATNPLKQVPAQLCHASLHVGLH